MSPFTVVCVLKSGGAYDQAYVQRLAGAARRRLPDARIVCLSDCQIPGVEVIPLVHDWPGWWSKLQAFTVPGPALYLDLDTVIVGSLDGLVDQIRDLGDRLLMIHDFYKPKHPQSGVMGWAGDASWLYEVFKVELQGATWQKTARFTALHAPSGAYKGDGQWIAATVPKRLLAFPGRGVCSYKVDCRHGLPRDMSLVCFHGLPRPADVDPMPAWMRENWLNVEGA